MTQVLRDDFSNGLSDWSIYTEGTSSITGTTSVHDTGYTQSIRVDVPDGPSDYSAIANREFTWPANGHLWLTCVIRQDHAGTLLNFGGGF